MADVVATAVALLEDIAVFSQFVIGVPLRPYQLRCLRPVIESIVNRRGREFLIVMPRQSGKNEAVAQLLVYLLNLFRRRGGNVVYGATGDGLGRGVDRLEKRLDNVLNRGSWGKGLRPLRRTLGRAAVVFLSTHKNALARGETADWLLVVDELQDQSYHHLAAVFEPMRAAGNATALYIGTVRTTNDALWLKKAELMAASVKDGVVRVFIVEPDEVAGELEEYGLFLARQVARYGRNHPIIASEYYNEPLEGSGGLFDRRRQNLMRGEHGRGRVPESGVLYVATLDVAGQDEAATDPIAQLERPARDYTVAHVFEISLDSRAEWPSYKAVDVFVDHGGRHFQDVPGRPRLADRLLAWLQHWRVSHVVGDASGVGAGLVDWLTAKMSCGVTAVQFSPRRKAQIGSRFLSVVETGRFRYWSGSERPLSDAWWFFRQVEACSYAVPPGGQLERDLAWFVPDSARVDTPAGRLPVHDDRLVSAALVAVCDELYAAGDLKLGEGKSAVVRPVIPFGDHVY